MLVKRELSYSCQYMELVTVSQCHLIPISILRDHSQMREVGERTETLRVSFKLVESFTHLVNYVIKGCKSQIRELFFAQFFPHMFHRIELWTVGSCQDFAQKGAGVTFLCEPELVKRNLTRQTEERSNLMKSEQGGFLCNTILHFTRNEPGPALRKRPRSRKVDKCDTVLSYGESVS